MSNAKESKLKTSTIIFLSILFIIILAIVYNIKTCSVITETVLKSNWLRHITIAATILTFTIKVYVDYQLDRCDLFYTCFTFVTYGAMFYTFHNLTYISYFHLISGQTLMENFGGLDMGLFTVSSLIMFLKPIPQLIDSWKEFIEYSNSVTVIPEV